LNKVRQFQLVHFVFSEKSADGFATMALSPFVGCQQAAERA
jgi:hypothetical protein